MPAGELRERLEFQQRAEQSDGYGGQIADFAAEFTVAARIRPLKGGEAVLASRLSGVQPVIITVRYSSETVQIRSDWRARDVRSGVLYAIKSPPTNTDEKRRYLDILASIGEAA